MPSKNETTPFNPEQLKNNKFTPVFEYGGIKWPTFPPFRAKGAERAVKDIMMIPAKDTDILICTYIKSGTHWIHEITKMLPKNSKELDKESKLSMMLDMIPDLSSLDTVPSPRILNTHFQFQYIPIEHIERRNKIIHIVRNPKDVLVSFYHHAQKDVFLDLSVPFPAFFDICMSEKVPYGSWYEYELGMEQAQNKYPEMIYTCYYEALKKDPETEIKKLADFLEVKCSDDMIKLIAKETTFENMQTNKVDPTKFIGEGEKGFIYRKGEIGDWKNHFTVLQNERFDEQFYDKMKDSKYKLIFD